MNGFKDVLEGFQGGALLKEIDVELREVISAVENTKRPGEITVTFKISPPGRADAVPVEGIVKSKVPEFPREKAFFFIGDDGGLQGEHPNQTEMFQGENVRAIAQGKGE